MELPVGRPVRRSSTFPTRQSPLARLPAEYMERGDMIPDDMEFDDELGRFRFRERAPSVDTLLVSNDLNEQVKKTAKAITEYQKHSKLKFKTRWEVDASGSWDWDKVMEDMKAAEVAYEGLAKVDSKDSKTEKCYKLIRKCFRNFSLHAQSFKDWLAVLPDGDYGSIICGSLGMIFTAATKLGKVRHESLEALSEMPETIALVHSYRDIYQNSTQMRLAILRFEVCTLMALEFTLLWLTENPISKYFDALRKQGGYGKSLQTAFGAFKWSMEKLNDRARLSLHEMSKDSNNQIRTGRLEQAQNTATLASINSDVQDVKHRNDKLGNQLECQNEDVQQVKLQAEKILEVANTILEQLQCNPRLQEVSDALHQRRRAVNKDSDECSDDDFAFPQIVHRATLQRVIGSAFLNSARCDFEAATESAYLISFEEQDRQADLAESSILRDFLTTTCSSTALIQGNSSHDDAIAFTSVYAAMLIVALQGYCIPVIHFVCGLHKNPSTQDNFLGPFGMMLGLLQQLVEVYPNNSLPFLEHDILYSQFSSIESIGWLMQVLVANGPQNSATFCIVDGISFFENSTCEKQTNEAITQLLHVVLASKGCFKLLFTSPTRSIYVPQRLMHWPGSKYMLEVPSEMLHGRRQGVRPQVLQQTMSDTFLQTRQLPSWPPASEQWY